MYNVMTIEDFEILGQAMEEVAAEERAEWEAYVADCKTNPWG